MIAMFVPGILEIIIVAGLCGVPLIALVVFLNVRSRRPGEAPPHGENLLPCPDCGLMVSSRAATCPHCGRLFGKGV